MQIAKNDGGQVEWHSTALGTEALDAALSRDRNLTLRFGERLLADSEHCGPTHSSPSSAS